MEKSTVINYVCENSFTDEFSKSRLVRFPYPSSGMIFSAKDDETLVGRIWNYIQTVDGRKLISKVDFTSYEDEFYMSGDEE